MSKLIQHGKDKEAATKSIKFAVVIAIIWAAIIAGLWFAMKAMPEDGSSFLNFLGRLHPIIVHIPIGVLLVIGVIEILGRGEKGASARGSVPMLLWLSFVGAVGATIMGYMLMKSEDFQGKAMNIHLWTGLAVVVLSFLALISKLADKRGAYALSLFLSIVGVGAAGHYGGAMVHGPEYITENAPEPIKKMLEPVLFAGLGHATAEEETELAGEDGNNTKTEVAVDQQVAYTKFIAPILKAKCTECHDENKIKGKLRMDTHELLMAGAEGSDYPTVKPGDPENSEMIVRVTLPADDDDFMPPGENEALTPEEIKILSWWVKTGASADKTVAELSPEDEILGALAVIDATRKGAEVEKIVWVPEWDTLSEEEKTTRLADAQEAAAKYNFSLMPISAEDDRLRVNVINASKDFGDTQLAALEPIAEHILWLDVARSQITDEGMKSVNKMRRLERLHLEETKVTDKGIALIEPLTNLSYLNLYGTDVSDAIFEHLSGMSNLQKLFVWQTKVDPAAARAFERSVNLEINTGVDLAAVAAEKAAAAKAEAEKAAAEKAAAEKAEADKKAAAAKVAAEKAAAAKKAAEAKLAAEKAEKAKAEKAKMEKAKADAAKAAADKAKADKAKADAAKVAAEKAKADAAKKPAPAPKPEAKPDAPKASPKEAPKAQ